MKFIPEACTGEKALFEGSMEVTAPSFEERYQYIDESELDLNQVSEEDNSQVRGQLRAVRKLVGFSKKHVKSVSIKRKSDGTEFKSFDALSSDPSCDAMLIELGTKMATGFNGERLGNG